MSKENNYRRFSDEELVKAILEGDTDAYTEVMSRYIAVKMRSLIF